MQLIPKPQPSEYAPYYAPYIALVPDDGQVLTHLATHLDLLETQIRGYSPAHCITPHTAGEWTINEILLHLLDAERVFAYRALRIARADTTPLPSYEHDDYVPYSRANERAVEDILSEYRAVRQATLALFRSFDEAALVRLGTASTQPISVRALIYNVAGHERHHLHSIRQNYG